MVVVSKLDLVDEEERDAVLGRVRDLGGEAGAALAGAGARPRRPPLEVLAQLLAEAPSPRRAAAVARAAATVGAALGEIAAPVDPDALQERVRAGLQAAVARIEAGVASGALANAHDAEVALGQALVALVSEVRSWTGRDGPRLPLPQVEALTPLERVREGLGGAELARRAAKAAAARWWVEVQCELQDWPGAPAARRRAAARRRLDEALAAVATLTRGSARDAI
ncbi:MAG: hypothetical protein R3F59_17265 [Myxococcota bacterium]